MSAESILSDDFFRGIYKSYPEMTEIAVIDSWSTEEYIEEVEAYFEEQGIEVYSDESATVDHNQGIAYHNASDFLLLDGEVCGRHGFEEGDYTFDSSLAE